MTFIHLIMRCGSLALLLLFTSMSANAQQRTGNMPPGPEAARQKGASGAKTEFPKASQYSNTKLTYKIIPAPHSTFCYDIFAEGRLMIHQPSVPGLPGNDGFKTRAGAEKVAKLVIKKIKRGEMPPTIELAEMKNIKAI